MYNRMMTWAGALALGAALLPALAHASQTYNTTMTFQSMNQSPWGSGPQQKATFDKFVGATWGLASGTAGGYTDITIPSVTICDPFDGPGDDASFGEGSVVDDDSSVPDCSTTPPVDLGQFGAVASGSTQGSAGLHFYAYADAGSLNVTYPIQATINYPDNGVLYPGDTFTISTSYAPEATDPISGLSPAITSASPSAGVQVNADFDASFYANINAEAFSSNLFNITPVNTTIGPLDLTLLDTDNPTFRSLVTGLGSYALGTATDQIITGHFHVPNFGSNGGLVGAHDLVSTGSDTFLTLKGDVTNLLLALADVPAIERNISVDASIASFSGTLALADLYEQLDFTAQQSFDFTPSPQVTLQLSDGQIVTVPVPGTTTLTMPSVTDPHATSNSLSFTPTFALDNGVRNTTTLVYNPSFDLNPLEVAASGSVAGHSLGSFDFQPVSTLTLASADVPIPIFSKNFQMGGFNTPVTTPFTVNGYVYPTPVLTALQPNMIKQGTGNTDVIATGASFVPAHGINPSTAGDWNGAATLIAATFASSTQTTLHVPGTDFATEGTFPVSAVNPPPRGGPSNTLPFIVDGTPPNTTDTLTPVPDLQGWNNSPVQVGLRSVDPLLRDGTTPSGVNHVTEDATADPTFGGQNILATNVPGSTASLAISNQGLTTVHYFGTDNVDNVETAKSQIVRIDTVKPGITYTGNAGSYTVDQNVTITVGATDNLSGIFSFTGRSSTDSGYSFSVSPPAWGTLSVAGTTITGPAWQFVSGTNSYSSAATDFADNATSASTSFVVTATPATLCTITERFLAQTGAPGADGLAKALCAKLEQAADAAAAGHAQAGAGAIRAFISEVEALSGKKLTIAQASTLIRWAQTL